MSRSTGATDRICGNSARVRHPTRPALLGDYGRALYENTDYAILGWGFGVCFLGLSLITDRTNNVTQGLTNEWMMMLMTEKETCHEMMDRSVEATIRCLKLLNEAVGDYVFAWGIASDDSGTQRGEFIRLSLPRCSVSLPQALRLSTRTRPEDLLPPLRLRSPLDPAFHRSRIDILNPVQTWL